MTRFQELDDDARAVGLYVATYSPGGGQTRYRFFNTPGNTYFGPDNGIFTALGFHDADIWLTGYTACFLAPSALSR